jgi:hypothetical protein
MRWTPTPHNNSHFLEKLLYVWKFAEFRPKTLGTEVLNMGKQRSRSLGSVLPNF